MSDSFPDIKPVVVRVITNKPVRKTPYQASIQIKTLYQCWMDLIEIDISIREFK